MGWYHWECQKVTEKPVGTWLCLSCSPNAAFYAKQLEKRHTAAPPVPQLKKGATPSSIQPITKVPKVTTQSSLKEKEPISHSGPSAAPTSSKEKEQDKGTVKKGTAVRKPIPEKPKQKWVGWMEMNSEDEEEYKKNVDARFKLEDGVSGKRRRASRAVPEEIESGSRRLRARSRPGAQVSKRVSSDSEEEDEDEEVDSEESVYQEEDNEESEEEEEDVEEEEEAPVSEDSSDRGKMSENEEKSDEYEYFEDTMEVDEDNNDSLDELFEGSPDVDEDLFVSQGQLPTETNLSGDAMGDASEDNEEENPPSEALTEYWESPMDVEPDEDDTPEPSSSAPSDNSEYVDVDVNADDDTSFPSPQPPPKVYYARKRGQRSSPSPESTPPTSSASPSTASSSHEEVMITHEQIVVSDDDDGMDLDSENGDSEVQILEGGQGPVSAAPAVESSDIATLYQRQGNRWGEFPESAERSTLPRLG